MNKILFNNVLYTLEPYNSYYRISRDDQEKINQTHIIKSILSLRGYDVNELKEGNLFLGKLLYKEINDIEIPFVRVNEKQGEVVDDTLIINGNEIDRPRVTSTHNHHKRQVVNEDLTPSSLSPIEFYRLSESFLNEYIQKDEVNIDDIDKYYELTDYCDSWVYKRIYHLNLNTPRNQINYLFAQFAYHFNNDRTAIFYEFTEHIDTRVRIFKNFDAQDFLSSYQDLSNQQVIELFLPLVKKEDNEDTRDKIIKYFTILIRSCRYLVDKGSYQNVIDDLISNETTSIDSVPNYLLDHVIGRGNNVGLALSTDLVKELNEHFSYLVKPDHHLITILARYYGVKTLSQKKVMEKARELVASINESLEEPITVYQFDRMLYLIGSGFFFLDNGRYPNHKQVKIQYMNQIS